MKAFEVAVALFVAVMAFVVLKLIGGRATRAGEAVQLLDFG